MDEGRKTRGDGRRMKSNRVSSIEHRASRSTLFTIRSTLYAIRYFLLVGLLLFFLPTSLGAEESAKEKPLSTELPIIVVKGEDRSYLEITRARTLSLMQHRGEKSSLLPAFEAGLAEKIYYHFLFFPGLEIEKLPPLEKPSVKEKKEIYPAALLEPRFKKPLISYYIPSRSKKIFFMQHRGEKRPAQPLIQLPLGEKISYPTPKEKSALPYLHISASAGDHNSLAYQLDYGKEKEKMMYFLFLGKVSSSEGVRHKGSSLAKNEDWLNGEFIWNSSEKRRKLFNLEGYQKKISLPGGKERNKNKLGLKGDFTFELQEDKIFRASAWLEKTELIGPEPEYHQDITSGIQIELEKPDISLQGGAKAEYSSYAPNQIHLWVRNEAIAFKRIKNLTGQLEIGIKQIGERGSQIIPHLKLLYRIGPKKEFQVVVEKKFYSLGLADLYLFRDYVEVNQDPDFNKIVDTWDCKGEFKYKFSPQLDISLEGFFKTGQDIIWNWDDIKSLVKPENRSINSWGVQLNLRHFGKTFEKGFSWVLQTAENAEDPNKVIPYYPPSIIDIWLRWKKNTWKAEAKAWVVGERYYKEGIEDKLPSGWRGIFKISKTMGKNKELFIQLELNDYQLWKDYSLPKEKLSLGIKYNLY